MAGHTCYNTHKVFTPASAHGTWSSLFSCVLATQMLVTAGLTCSMKRSWSQVSHVLILWLQASCEAMRSLTESAFGHLATHSDAASQLSSATSALVRPGVPGTQEFPVPWMLLKVWISEHLRPAQC